MKHLFILLLLVNLVMAMWWLWIEPARAPLPAADSQAGSPAKLVLVSELDALLAAGSPSGEVTGLAMAVPGSPDEAADPGAQSVSQAPGVGAPPESPDNSVAIDGADGAATTEPLVEGPAPPVIEPALIPPVAAVITAPVQDPPPPAADLRCVSLGPFLNLRDATVAGSRLRAEGFDPRQRLARSQVWMGFWVHLPAFESRAAAVAAVERLREKGIDDIYIEPAGPRRNSVSLGVFSDQSRADSHAAAIGALGVDVSAQVVERYRDDEVYWLDFELARDQVMEPEIYAPSTSQTLRLEDPGCS